MIDKRYDTVIGLEAHVQLKTRTKMFCGCAYHFGAPPNSQTCPSCLGLPGALPVANREAFRLGLRVGLALQCRIAETLRFDRKQYFYPDLPKAYQITQFETPSHFDGHLDLSFGQAGETVHILRAHLEEDSGKSLHGNKDEGTLIDLNRCGVPLLEIVTTPSIHSADMALDYLRELRLILRYIGASDCDMEKGSLRCDVNISLKPKGSTTLGRKIELKNLNSNRMIKRAIEYEQKRQAALYDTSKGIGAEESRTWDDEAGESRSMRRKESSADYRYFPDPDLPRFRIAKAWIEETKAQLPELPGPRFKRYQSQLGLSAKDAQQLVQNASAANYFEELTNLISSAKKAANWVIAKVLPALKAAPHLNAAANSAEAIAPIRPTPTIVAELINMTTEGLISQDAAHTLFDELRSSTASPQDLAKTLDLLQLNDPDQLRELLRQSIDANPDTWEALKSGTQPAQHALVGWAMRQSQGRANAAKLSELLRDMTI
ncbi:MAG: Asp-tRNA(Asn)/Glu-tRNA(Gln) amidotransferase subunit GatB [Planctomycetota bacterium]